MMTKQPINNCRGLTLIELMISLLLSLLIMGAAISIFLSNKESFRLGEEISILQENFRFIADRFNKDFGNAGFTGCSTPYELDTPTVNPLISSLGPHDMIRGVEGGAGSDSITIDYALVDTGVPVVDPSPKPGPLYISKNTPLFQALQDNFSSGSGPVPVSLLVGNCDDADIFLVTAAQEAIGPDSGLSVGAIEHQAGVDVGGVTNTDGDLSSIYGLSTLSSATVYQRESVTYLIDTVAGVTGLYEQRGSGAQQLVLGDVTNMQVQYGTDSMSNGNANTYVDWSSAIQVSRINAVKITITMVVSNKGGTQTTRDYSFTQKLRNMGL